MAKTYKAIPKDPSQFSDKARRVRWLSQQFDRYETYWRPEIERAIRNARMYWAVDFGQWPSYVVEKLRSQGRRPPTYPIIPDKLESLVSTQLSDEWGVAFNPDGGDISRLTLRVDDLWTADKAQMDWETSEIMSLLDAWIMVGFERMTVYDYQDPFGRIAWEHPDPTHVLMDPGWKTDYPRDMRNYFDWSMMTAKQIIEHPLFRKQSDRLRELYEREMREGIDYGQYEGAIPQYKTVEEKWSSRHRVMSFHYLEEEHRDWEYDLKNNAFFPDTGEKLGSERDREIKRRYVGIAQLGPDNITYMPQTRRIKRIETAAPTIDTDLFLQAGADIIQTDNCNLYPLGIRFRGQYAGVVDRLYDIQINYNKSKMHIQDILARSAHGAFFLDRLLSGGDVALERQIEEAWNDPAARVWVDEGATRNLTNGGVIPFPESRVGPELLNSPDKDLELSDRFSNVPAAAQSRTESAKESGRLYNLKLQTAMQGLTFLNRFVKRHKIAKATAYILQIKSTYAGMPRRFSKPGSKEAFWLNQRAKNLVTGQEQIIDDIMLLPPMRVECYLSKKGYTQRQTLRMQYSDIVEAIGNDPVYSLLKTTCFVEILETEDMPDDSKERVHQAANLILRDQATQMMLRIAGSEKQLKKLAAVAQGGGQAAPEEETTPPAVRPGGIDQGAVAAGTPMAAQ